MKPINTMYLTGVVSQLTYFSRTGKRKNVSKSGSKREVIAGFVTYLTKVLQEKRVSPALVAAREALDATGVNESNSDSDSCHFAMVPRRTPLPSTI